MTGNKIVARNALIWFRALLTILIVPILYLLRIKVVLLSEKGRLSLFNTYIESALRRARDTPIGERGAGYLYRKIIFINPYEVPNEAILKLYKSYVKIFCLNLHRGPALTWHIRNLIWRALRLIERGEGVVELGTPRLSTISGIVLWRCGEPTINIGKVRWNKSSLEFERLKAHIELNKPFCLLALREEEYYRNKVNIDRNNEAQDVFMKRNPSFHDFIPSIKSLIENGMQVVKVGTSGKRANLELEGFYDFCGEGYCPEVDVYLAMNCRFLISGSCGYTYQCTIFNKPVFTTHVYSPKHYFNGSHGIFYPSIITYDGNKLSLSKSLLINVDSIDSNINYLQPSAFELRDAIMEYYTEFLEDYENERGVCFDMGALHSARISASLAFVSPSWIRHNPSLVDI